MTQYQKRELFREANQLYSAGDFTGAARRYTALLDAGLAYPEIYYNAGNACAKMGEPGLAVWNYEKARRMAPRDDDIRANLRQLSPPENHPAPFVLLWPFIALSGLFSLSEAVSIGAAAWWLGLLALAGAVMARGAWARGRFHLAGRLALAVFLVFAVIAGAKAYDRYARGWAIVTASSVIGHAAPNEQASKEYDLPSGLRVLRVADHQGGWAEIRIPGGGRTFVHQNEIRSL